MIAGKADRWHHHLRHLAAGARLLNLFGGVTMLQFNAKARACRSRAGFPDHAPVPVDHPRARPDFQNVVHPRQCRRYRSRSSRTSWLDNRRFALASTPQSTLHWATMIRLLETVLRSTRRLELARVADRAGRLQQEGEKRRRHDAGWLDDHDHHHVEHHDVGVRPGDPQPVAGAASARSRSPSPRRPGRRRWLDLRARQRARPASIVTSFIEKVPEGPTPGACWRTRATSSSSATFGYMEPMQRRPTCPTSSSSMRPATTAPNMRTYDSRTYEGAYMAGVIAGGLVLGVVGSIPEVIRNIDSFTMGALGQSEDQDQGRLGQRVVQPAGKPTRRSRSSTAAPTC